MKTPPFAYARASELDEALEMLDDAGEDAKLLAGGQSLLPLLAYRLARPTHLVDIGRIAGLDGLRETAGGLIVDALVTHANLESQIGLPARWRALTEAAALIGHYPIRVRGTIGGSLAHADPAAELSVVATALGADLLVRSIGSSREIAVEDFFYGPYMTVLEPNEMVVGVRFRPADVARRSAFDEFSTRHGDFAFASTAVAATFEDGVARDVRIALGAVGPVPVRAVAAETALEGSSMSGPEIDAAAQLAMNNCEPAGDARASGEFRRELIEVLVARSLRRLKEME